MKAFVLLFLGALAQASPAPRYGILLIAPEGGPGHKKAVAALREDLGTGVPIAVAFVGTDTASLKRGVASLEESKVGKIVAVPLFTDSGSEVLDRIRYILGLKGVASKTMRRAARMKRKGRVVLSLKRVKTRLPLIMTPALDAHPLMAEVLTARARALSRNPRGEIVILVASGPSDSRGRRAVKRTMKDLSQMIWERGNFKSVEGAMLRGDAPQNIRKKAAAKLRKRVSRLALKGRVIVIPYLLTEGEARDRIAAALKGLRYAWDGNTILPHDNVAAWVRGSAADGAKKENMKIFR